MPRKILILTEDQVKRVTDALLNEQQEKVYTDFDRAWDYKFSNNQWSASRKGTNKWVSLANYPDAIKKLNDRYYPKPVNRVAQNVVKSVNKTSDRAIEKTQSMASTFPERLKSTGNSIIVFFPIRFRTV